MHNSAELGPWQISTATVAPFQARNYDAAIMIFCGFSLAGLAVADFAFVVDFGNKNHRTANCRYAFRRMS